MPEGDTVWLAAQRLNAALGGKQLVISDFRVPALATVSLVGETVLEVVSRGKHLLTRLSSARTLHTHFRMDGSWHLYSPGTAWHGGPEFQIRVVLAVPDKVAVGYRLPIVDLLRTEDEGSVVGHLGPDVLDDSFDLDEAVRRLGGDPDREIGMALLDQRNLAGLGNLYRTEVLFLRGLSPWTPAREVDLPALVRTSVKLMRANMNRWEQTTTGSLQPGADHWVFERANKPCRRCQTRVQRAEQGDAPYARLTYWCPRCQPGVPSNAPSVTRVPPVSPRHRYRP